MNEQVEQVTRSQSGRTAERLAAVQLLLLADRDQKAHDILLATVLERLESGPKTFDELLLQTREAWPGVSLSRSLLRSTIRAAQDAGLLLPVDPGMLTGAAWTLGTLGRQDIEAAQGWAADIVDRTESQVADEARRVLGSANTSDVVRWSEILLDVLVMGIAKALTADGGGFRVVGDAYLFPSEYDLDFLDGQVASSCHDAAVADLLRLLVRAALDPARAFATELVHHISTGYVLFAYLGRMHSSGARHAVGPLSGEIAILDTPLLLRLLGGPPGRSAIVDLISLGLGSGMEIVVHETTLIELDHLLERHTEDALRFEAALGPHPNVGELGIQDEVLETWLQARPLGSVGHLSWTQFRRRAADLRNDLRALGVKVVDSKVWDIAQASLHARFNDSLAETIRSRGGYRHRVPIDHDARLLVHVSEDRIRNPRNEKKIWPGSIVITTDSYMTAAFEAVAGKQEFPVAVTPAQWAGLLGSCSPPAAAERLAGLVGQELSRRTLLARAAAIPVEVAIELARSVSVDHESAVDPYAIQLSLQEVLAEQPDLLDPSGSDARQLANAIVARRQQRMQRAYMQQRSATAAEARRKEAEVQDRERLALGALAAVEARSNRLETLEQQLDAETRRRVTLTRLVVVLIPSLLGIAALASSAAARALEGKHLGLACIGLVLFIASGADYILHEDRRWWEPASGLVVGVALALLPLYL